MTLFRSALRSSFVAAAASRVLLVLQFVLIAKIAAIEFSLTDVGLFFLFYNIALLISAILFSTQSAGLLRFYSLVDHKNKLYGVLFYQLLVPIIISVIGLILYLTLSPNAAQYGRFAIIIVLHGLSVGYFLNLTTSFRVKSDFLGLLAYTGLQFIFCAGLISASYFSFGLSLAVLILSMTLANMACVAIFLARGFNKLSELYKTALDLKLGRRVFVFGLPLVLVSLFNLLLSSTGQFILKYYGFDQELGVYSANYNVGEKMIFVVLSLLVTVKVPELYRKARIGLQVALDMLKKIVFGFIIFCAIILLGAYCFSEEISRIFTSDSIASLGHWIIPMTVLSASILGVASLCSEVLLFYGRSMALAICYGAGALFHLLLCMLLIPEIGLWGAVLSSVFANVVLLIFVLGYSRLLIINESAENKFSDDL